MNIFSTPRASRVIASAAVLSFSTLALAAPANTPFKSKQGYSIVPPAGLQKYPTSVPQMDVMFVNRNGASMNIIIREVPKGTSATASRDVARTMMKQSMSKFQVLSQGTMLLNGTQAATLASTFETGTPPAKVRLLSVLAIRGGKAYAFSCGGPAALYPRYDAAFKKSLASVRWTK